MVKKKIEITLAGKRERLELYLEQEKMMLSGAVQSYGIGSRNLTRYNMDLSAIRAAIKELEEEIQDLENQLAGVKNRKAIAAIPRDW